MKLLRLYSLLCTIAMTVVIIYVYFEALGTLGRYMARETWHITTQIEPAPYTTFRMVANLQSRMIQTNADGFREQELVAHPIRLQIGKDKYVIKLPHIIVLGGSTAWGSFATSNATTFAGFLERCLPQYKVINLSMGGYNSFQEFITLRLFGERLNPEIVINLTGYNDVWHGRNSRDIVLPYCWQTFQDFWDSQSYKGFLQYYWHYWFPVQYIRMKLSTTTAETMPDTLNNVPVRWFNLTMELINAYCQIINARHIVILQPVRTPQSEIETYYLRQMERLIKGERQYEIVNTIHSLPDSVFVDSVHLTDLGFQQLAQIISKEVK